MTEAPRNEKLDTETSDRIWGVGGWVECARPECLDHYGQQTHHSVEYHDD